MVKKKAGLQFFLVQEELQEDFNFPLKWDSYDQCNGLSWCSTQISWDPFCHFCTAFLRSGLLLPQTAYTVHRNIFLWGLLSYGTAGQQEQRASVPASPHLHTRLPSPASDWQRNIKTQLFSSAENNSEVWPPLNNSPAGLKTIPSTWSEASPWLGFCLSQTLTNFSWKHFPEAKCS